MMWARLIGSVLILAGGIVCAQSAGEGVAAGLESCFQAARIADAICSKLEPNDAGPRLDCFQKTRAAQLECLEHVLSETPAGPSAPRDSAGSQPSGPPANAALPEGSSKQVSPEQPGRTGLSTGSNLPQETGNPAKASPGMNPPELPAPPETTTGAIRPDLSPKTTELPKRTTDTDWVVSETTSPIDYSPLVTALIRSRSQVKDAPSTLTIRCRGHRTELLVRTDGAWGTTRGNELRGEYQINDQRTVGQQWILSSDGRTATYKDDPVALLQSLPDGARLKISMADRASPAHEATFRLDGWDAVRKKIGTACKWAPTTEKASSDKR
jgi:hypothetical protein